MTRKTNHKLDEALAALMRDPSKRSVFDDRRFAPVVDYEAWALELCTLLDRIDIAIGEIPEAFNCQAVDDLRWIVRQRFAIAEKHGLTVEFGGETSGETQ